MSEMHGAATPAPPAAAPALRKGALGAWWGQGARSAFLLRPSWDGLPLTPALLACLYLVPLAAGLGIERLYIDGPAFFHAPALLGHGGVGLAATLFGCWLLVRGRPADGPPPHGAAALYAMVCAQAFTVMLLVSLVFLPIARGGAFEADSPTRSLAQAAWYAGTAWAFGALAVLLWRASRLAPPLRALVVGAVVGLGLLQDVFAPTRHWYPERAAQADAAQPEFRLTQDKVEAQSHALHEDLKALLPQRRGVADLYVLTFAPDADAEVFRRESALVAEVMQGRFDARGRTLELVNHRSESARPAWATPLNLQRAIRHVAGLMDPDEDLLFIHLTSHGARNGELAPAFWPLHVDPLTPALLKRWLDEAGIRWRVVSISSCYSGSWIAPLAGDGTLVMTAADAEHTSYGCGRHSELTFFGRAMFDEQLRKTWSFEEAHAAVRPVIAEREQAAGKDDGYSNPQIAVGAGVAARLRELQAQRAAAAR